MPRVRVQLADGSFKHVNMTREELVRYNTTGELSGEVANQDNLLMKSGYVVAETPTPIIDNVIGSSVADVSSMDWSDIHKMVENAGGQ